MTNWLDKQVHLYSSHADNYGKPATYRYVLFDAVYQPHTYLDTREWFLAGPIVDKDLIEELRKANRESKYYKEYKLAIKAALQCYTPAAWLESKKKGNIILNERTGIMQLDFDSCAIKDYDIEELKQAVFSLPFVGYCGLSCSGDGFYALALIAEPEKLSEYAEHCFEVLKDYGVPADESKGKKIENLRYLSYDPKALFREDPEPLLIKHFRTKEKPKAKLKVVKQGDRVHSGNSILLNGLDQVKNAIVGNRWETIQRVAYTLGGLQDNSLLDQIKHLINEGPQYTGEEDKYCTCAEVCFKAGSENPLKKAA